MDRPGLMAILVTARELVAFSWRNKNWWLTPLILLVLLLSLVVVVLESSALAPFIYAIF